MAQRRSKNSLWLKIWRHNLPVPLFASFRKRVLRGLERMAQSGATSVLLVSHKGPIRTIAEELVGAALPDDEPGLAGVVGLSRGAADAWVLGRRGSDPEGLA